MARKIANSTCTVCHEICPRTEMQQISFEENSGSSLGISANVGSGKKANPRASARSYKRKRKAWVCNSCAPKVKAKKFMSGVIGLALVIAFVVGGAYLVAKL